MGPTAAWSKMTLGSPPEAAARAVVSLGAPVAEVSPSAAAGAVVDEVASFSSPLRVK
jgi:hypothetical protein